MAGSALATEQSHLRRRRRVRLVALFVMPALATCLCLAGYATPTDKRPPWVAKDWTQWSWEDCIAVLNGSPWSRVESFGGIGRIFTLVQLRSALPVRQALLRDLQIHKHYDKMDAQKRREFDQQNSEQLNEEAKDNVVILIDHDFYDREQRDSGEPAPPTQIALSFYGHPLVLPIQTKKVNYPPTFAEFGAVYNQFEYVFPRAVGGKPLLPGSNLFLGIDLGEPLIVDKKTGKVEQQDFRSAGLAFEFKISDLMYKGKLEY